MEGERSNDRAAVRACWPGIRSQPGTPPGRTGSPFRALRSRRIKAEHIRDYGIVVFAVALFAYFSFASPDFLTWQNLLNLVFQNATLGIAACAVTYTIIAGNFDLSLGAIFVLSEVLGAWAAVHWGVWWAFPVAIGSGLAMGLINGLLVTKLRVNAFLATLASALTFGGIAVGVTGGGLLITPTSRVFTFLGQNRTGGHPVSGHHLRPSRDRPPARAGVHRFRPPPLRRRRQPQRGPAVGSQSGPDRDPHVRHHRCRLRPLGPARLVDDRVGVE